MIQHGSLSLPLVKAGSPNCQVINETSQQVYDLRPLTRISGDDWKVKSEGFNYEFGLNVCNVILNTSNVNQDDKVGIWGELVAVGVLATLAEADEAGDTARAAGADASAAVKTGLINKTSEIIGCHRNTAANLNKSPYRYHKD
ncbi:3659_t:CDS:2 [Scutellospora calospora]|uniref:3659_t:CDS:1 n=1 Tax=Scutellospora calospora TaxID=85575 RepID=A0ACA9KXF7_9GLOM|nr:3659_t:CDS:2 [Scutellospora calospora]